MKYLNLSINNKFLYFIKKKWYLIVLVLISFLSFWINLYNISEYGYGNEYYAAAIRSMTQNFKNFFFVSFDPSGMISVDKPPLGLWMQAISVLIFGYNGWAMLIPQALAGTCSCIVLYILVSKYFSHQAGLLSSFMFSFTPIVVATSRNNTMDMQLVFTLLIATYFLFKSIEISKKRYLFIAGIFLGIGFNIKMLEAYLVLPTFVLVYLIFSREKLSKRIINGLISSTIMVVISFAWVLAVDLYPSDNRPYVDSSTNNSVSELIIGHNGLERIYGRQSGKSLMDDHNLKYTKDSDYHSKDKLNSTHQSYNDQIYQTSFNKFDHTNQSDSLPNKDYKNNIQINRGGNEIGDASFLRLWNSNLYGQISWLLIFSGCSIIITIRKLTIRKLTLKEVTTIFWILWLITISIFFSFAGFFHRYYLCILAPAISALCGIGTIEMYTELSNKSSWRQFILPFSLISTIIIEIIYVLNYKGLRTLLISLIIIMTILSLLCITISYIRHKELLNYFSILFMLMAILIAPCYWAITPVMYVTNSTMPYAGPELASQPVNNFYKNYGGSSTNKLSGLQEYLVRNYKKGSFLVVSKRSSDVAQFIINTGLPAYAYGGFLGSDNSLTLDILKKYISDGKINYFLISDQDETGDQDFELLSYVKENALLIDPIEYGDFSVLGNYSNLLENNNYNYPLKGAPIFNDNISLYKFN